MGRTAYVPDELRSRPFSLEQARAYGLSFSALRGKSWRRIGSGLYCWTGLNDDPWQILAAWRDRLPHGAAFAGLTAAWLHGLGVDPLHPIEVAIPPKSDVRSRPGLLVRRCEQPDAVSFRDLPATGLRRTFADLSRRLAPVEVLVLADEALKLGLGRFHELAEHADSPMETRLRWLLMKAGLPAPEVQSDLHDDVGRFVARADLYYRSSQLVVEFDGGNHRERLVSDDRRQNALVGAGYRVLRFTSSDVYSRPESVVAQVRAGLSARDGGNVRNRAVDYARDGGNARNWRLGRIAT
jgi:very-short-patch-repair endonuclease